MVRWWIYKNVRKFMQPVEFEKAEKWKRRLALGYFLLAWNAFGLICYQYYQGRGDWAKAAGLKTEEDELMPVGAQFANMLGIQNAKVTRISGLRKVGEYEIKDGEIIRPAPSDSNSSETP
uniref:CSON010954 protein n=1 Tax=Culicoides sonorensis TaxID=179676 RepID=A0A336LQA4_CULSO